MTESRLGMDMVARAFSCSASCGVGFSGVGGGCGLAVLLLLLLLVFLAGAAVVLLCESFAEEAVCMAFFDEATGS